MIAAMVFAVTCAALGSGFLAVAAGRLADRELPEAAIDASLAAAAVMAGTAAIVQVLP